MCPVCGTKAINKDGQTYCPNCNIYLGNISDSYRIPEHVTKAADLEETGKVLEKRSKRNFIIKSLTIFLVVLIVVIGIGLFMLNFTTYGYREKVFYRYGFTTEARSYLRGTRIEVANIFEEKPLGLSHSGYWKPNTKSVRLNTANDEVAIHEFGHAWWEQFRGSKEARKNLIKDTITLSQMNDPTYNQTIERAKWIVKEFCSCENVKDIDYDKVDDHHFYAYTADFLMGQYKNGSHQLPKFMWKYFDRLFSGNTKKTPCYETQSCYFPKNNNARAV